MFKKGIALLLSVSLVLPLQTRAEVAPLWCGRYLRPSTVSQHRTLQESLNATGALNSDPVKVPAYYIPGMDKSLEIPDDFYYDYEGKISLLQELIQKTKIEIEDAFVKELSESMYMNFDSTNLYASPMNATLAQIPTLAVGIVCNPGCSSAQRLSAVSRAHVADLVRQKVPRMNLQELKQNLEITIQGINEIQAFQGAGDSLKNAKAYYLSMVTTAQGRLLITSSVKSQVGELGSEPLRPSVSVLAVRTGLRELYQQLRDHWMNREAWLQQQISRIDGQEHYLPLSPDYLPLMKTLSLYLVSAPAAVIQVFKKNPHLLPYLCHMLHDVDSFNFTYLYEESVSEFAWYIVPGEIAVVTGMFLFSGGLGLVPLLVATTALKGLTAYEVAKLIGKANNEEQEARFHESNMYIGLGTADTATEIEKLRIKSNTNAGEAAALVGLEVVGTSIARIASLRAMKEFVKSTATQRFSWLLRLLNDKQGARALYKLKIYNEKQLLTWFQKASSEDVKLLLFENHNFAFGKRLLLTDAGVATFQEIYAMSTKEIFDEINPFNTLYDAFTASVQNQ